MSDARTGPGEYEVFLVQNLTVTVESGVMLPYACLYCGWDGDEGHAGPWMVALGADRVEFFGRCGHEIDVRGAEAAPWRRSFATAERSGVTDDPRAAAGQFGLDGAGWPEYELMRAKAAGGAAGLVRAYLAVPLPADTPQALVEVRRQGRTVMELISAVWEHDALVTHLTRQAVEWLSGRALTADELMRWEAHAVAALRLVPPDFYRRACLESVWLMIGDVARAGAGHGTERRAQSANMGRLVVPVHLAAAVCAALPRAGLATVDADQAREVIAARCHQWRVYPHATDLVAGIQDDQTRMRTMAAELHRLRSPEITGPETP